VAAAILAELLPVDPNSRGGHHAAEIDEDALMLQSHRQSEMPSIDGDKLVLLIVKPMPRQDLVRVRDRYAFESGVIEYLRDSVRQVLFAEEPIVIEFVSPDERLGRINGRTK